MEGRTGRLRAGGVALAVVTALALLPGCAAFERSQSGSTQSMRATQPSPAPAFKATDSPAEAGAGTPGVQGIPAAASAAAKAAEQLVIRNDTMRIEVGSVTDSVSACRALAKRYGGIVSNLVVSTDTNVQPPQPVPMVEGGSSRGTPSGLPFRGSITMQVPVAKFEAFLEEAGKLGKVLTQSSDDRNVTQEHVDLKARLDNLKAEETRLRTFFAKAGSVNDMLAIERELARVRGEIESLTAQVNYLERQAAMATLTIELVEPEPLVRPAGVDWGIAEAFRNGVQGLATVLGGLITVTISLLPLILLTVGLILLARWMLRRRRAKLGARTPSPPPQA